jgi:hypothetical protein
MPEHLSRVFNAPSLVSPTPDVAHLATFSRAACAALKSHALMRSLNTTKSADNLVARWYSPDELAIIGCSQSGDSMSEEKHEVETRRQQLRTKLDAVVVGCLALFAAVAPHSIAATQIAFGLAMLVWIAKLVVGREVGYRRMPLEWPILVFVGWSVVAAFFSYEPTISLGKLRAVGLFLIVFLVAQNVKTLRAGKALAWLMVASCMINVGFVFWEKAAGRGLKIVELAPESPLRLVGIQPGDVILQADGKTISSVEQLSRAWRDKQGATLRLFFFRPEVYLTREMLIPDGEIPENPARILSAERWREFRAAGFYGWNYFTYAEVLQLIGSLALGLLITMRRKLSWRGVLLSLALLAIAYAIFLTVTRAVWGAFAVSATVMLVVQAGKRGLLIVGLCVIIAAPFAVNKLRTARSIPLISASEPSTSYRLTIWREAIQLLASKPRHLLVGVGMDSVKNRWREWGMFDNGRLPLGHMHSTPIQIAFERGLPALACFIWWFAVYLRFLWRAVRSDAAAEDEVFKGILLGTFGGTIGFLVSSLVHYNFGDSEVVMVVYFLMGLSQSLVGLSAEKGTERVGSVGRVTTSF